MAVRASREVVIDAPVEAILDVLADIDQVPSWSTLHRRAEVLDRHPDGRPHHVRATLRILGVTDRQILEYHWGPSWMVWDAEETFQQRGQHGEYNLTPVGQDRTRVRFDLIMELAAPVPHFLIKRGRRIVLDVATEKLKERVYRCLGSSAPKRT
ncbi:SRPBCC family protein [Mycolicibacterium thermoresistibile]|uniref:Polyketide cyclase / dehydrase family protein n=2 Tax=Mycolicibacterium thermoresistibile TaxID=1797 RepID=G7CGH2_MYCT3|nr:SRPBCC family protein [Mycolicibacterium thermoresistibile]EHI11932.1 polyketide cyclase / dehydrase family protein [Mycolicibacterium thermoresistibile ATCC 19527]MCV7188990.1 SRPBCC family protein [Mycolicibacterium thermoresistibile]GAT14824.1 polyketide cyclase / dehydrase and lipid transport [Mycolicibacterium thermoresistibile]SNW20048.1 Polyketide cyclase / dehydrase and lipid transport [Mycolicibacterium thermoresistibile]